MQAKYMGSGSASESSPLIMVKVSVCCALDGNGIIGPYWFEDADGHPVTVNTE